MYRDGTGVIILQRTKHNTPTIARLALFIHVEDLELIAFAAVVMTAGMTTTQELECDEQADVAEGR